MHIRNLLFFFPMLLAACNHSTPKNDPSKRMFHFEPVKGIKYDEVRRAFDNGIAFDAEGFQQEPEWAVRFTSDTTVQAYSPFQNKMLNFDLIFSHDGVYNFAREWFRVKKVSKDSLVLQRLEVNGKVIAKDIRSNVYMTFYSEAYINKLKTTVEELRKPRKVDSLFVQKHSEMANKDIFDSTHFFAARVPVQFTSKSPMIKVEKLNSVDKLKNQTASFNYLYPEYRVSIKPAYKDFSYTISAIVDEHGNLFVHRFNALEEREVRRKVLQGILDVYLSKLLTVTPGNTLGFTHSSVITLYLSGKK